MDNLERVSRVGLAAFRLAVRFGFHEGIDNHFSLALSDDGREFLVNRPALRRAQGERPAPGHGRRRGALGCWRDRALGALHPRPDARGAPDLKCILHTHMPYATALTSVAGARLEPINQNALRFIGQIAYDDAYGGLALDGEEGARLAGVLGDRRIRVHGQPRRRDHRQRRRGLRRPLLPRARLPEPGAGDVDRRPLKPVPADEVARTQAEFGHYEGHADVRFAALQPAPRARGAHDYAD